MEVTETLFTEKVEFLQNENAVQKHMRERLTEVGATNPTRLVRDWIADVDIDDWVREITETDRRQARVANHATERTGDVPSVGAFVAFRLARLAMTMGKGRKIQQSDLADAHHVACGPYVDLFVTDDRELHNALDLVRARLPFEWMSSPDFFGAIP